MRIQARSLVLHSEAHARFSSQRELHNLDHQQDRRDDQGEAQSQHADGTVADQTNQGNLAAATLSIIPLELLIAALGCLFSGWLHAAVDTGLLSFLLVIWLFISFVGPG